MTAAARPHEPVLLDEVMAGLAIRDDGCYIDGTFGRGGYSRALLQRLGPRGRVLAIDCDPEAVAAGQELVTLDSRFMVRHGRLGDLGQLAAVAGCSGGVDGIVFDLGVSSPQLDTPARGFSFTADGPLDMRMDPGHGVAAREWLARASETEIADTLYQLGEERDSRRLARAIVAARARAPITTTGELAAVVARATRRRGRRLHPATRTFQALRIKVNDELTEIERALPAAVDLLRAGGRLAVVSFHSLEDRIVKRFMRARARSAEGGPGLDIVERLVRPGRPEQLRNPRSRSARLRIAERAS